MLRFFRRWAALALVPFLASCARGGREFPGTGVVRAEFADGRLVVAHDEIAGYMPAMTMGFEVAAPAEAAARALQVGDRIAFNLQVGERRVEIGDFRVIGRVAPVVAAPPRVAMHRLHAGDSIPDFSLIDEQNRPLTAASLSGHFTILTFIFTRCPVPEYCPLIARRFGELQRAILANPERKGRVRLLSITLDPDFDRPPVLASYGRAVGADPSVWSFGTGSSAQVSSLVTAFSVYTERNGAVLDHTLCTALVDAQGRIVDLWRGNGWRIDEVLEAVRNAQ